MREQSSNRESSTAAIDTTDLRVTYADGTRAVTGIDLHVRQGECFGFLGPNGAGKTSVVKTLATLLTPTAGSVRIDGVDVRESPRTVRSAIGYMAQETSVDESLTARENVAFACALYGVPRDERSARIETLLDIVGLDDVADRRVDTFSGGMKKRLDVATALVHEPPILFLDEPTTGLDPRARHRLWEHVRTINERGVTVFLTTQYLAEADALCDRLSVIQDGRLVATDTPADLKRAVGGDVLELTLADPTEQRRADACRIARESGAFEASAIDQTEDGITVTAEHARQAGTDLLVALSEAGVGVVGFDVRSPSLDDVFFALTGETAETPEGTEETENPPDATDGDAAPATPVATDPGGRR